MLFTSRLRSRQFRDRLQVISEALGRLGSVYRLSVMNEIALGYDPFPDCEKEMKINYHCRETDGSVVEYREYDCT